MIRLVVIFANEILELHRDVAQVVGVDKSSTVIITEAVQICAAKILLVKQNDDLLLGLAHDCASHAEGNIVSAAGVEVQDARANLEIADMTFIEGRAPEGIVLSEHMEVSQELNTFASKLDVRVVVLDILPVLLQVVDDL